MKRFGLWLLLLAGCSASLTSFGAEIRLAIVSADPRATAAGELLTAEFSRPEFGVALLERAEVERIRREQNLTARNSADFARLGQALGAQGLLVLDVFEQKDATNLTAKLIAVQPGAALGFQAYSWPLAGVSQWPGMVGKQFAELLPKLGVLAQDAVPLSVLNLRSPLKTGEGARLESEATTLLINRLIAQPEIFVLERQRMTLLGAEKELKDMQEAPFWNGSYLLEGVVERGGATRDALTINARLVSPTGASPTLSVKSDAGDLNALIDQLAREVISRLGKTTNGVAWNPAAEAKRYLEEARWGMRWGNIALAQAAADSAWALGEHSLETALLRVNSYSASAGRVLSIARVVSEFSELVGPAGDPQPGVLAPLATALENLTELTPMIAAGSDSREWLKAGAGVLHLACAHLHCFWHHRDEASKFAGELERLRAAARAAERILLQGEERSDSRAYASGAGTNLWNLRLDWGWVLAESPEATVSEFGRMLDSGISRTQRREFLNLKHPWLMPWTESERARAPQVWASFIDELARSTNTAIALSGRLLYIRSPLPSDRELGRVERARREQLAADLMLKHRHELLCSEPELTRQAMGLLDGSVGDSYGQRQLAADTVRTNYLDAILTSGECYDNGMFGWLFRPSAFQTNHLSLLLAHMAQGFGTNGPVVSRKSLLKSYFAAQRPFHTAVFDQLFRAEDYNADEALPMLIRLKDWRNQERSDQPQNIAALNRHISALASIVTPAGVASAPSKTSLAADPNALAVTNFWRPVFTQSPTQSLVGYSVLQTLVRDGYVWAHVRGKYEFRWPQETPGWYHVSNRVFDQFYRIDSTDMSSLASPIFWRDGQSILLENAFGPFAELAVLDGVLYVHDAGKLASWNLRETQWRQVDVTLPQRMTLQAIGGRLYLGGVDALLEFNPTNLAVRIMASLRRNPPIVAEDRVRGYGVPVFLNGGSNTVLVLFDGGVHPWNVASGTWGEAFATALAGDFLSLDQDSVLSWQGQPYSDRLLHRFSGRTGDELLLEIKPNRGRVGPTTLTSKQPAIWKAPANLGGLILAPAPDGTNLWGFDSRLKALSYFDRSWEEPLELRLSLTPKVLTNASPFHDQYVLTSARNGLVVFRKLAEGFWLIPQKDLDIALRPAALIHRTPRTNAPAGARTPALKSTNDELAWADEAIPEAARVMRLYQSSQPGSLGLGELINAIQKEPKLAQYQSLTAKMPSALLLIAPYDTNDNIRIDLPELDAMIKLSKPRLTVDEFLGRWDTNRNGRLDGPEARAAVADWNARRAATRAATSPPRTNATARPRP